nr:neuroblastoma breakpoint family member 4-like isoform X6 [Microcebus murinus]
MMSDRELRYVSLDISEFAENPADEEGEEEKEPQMNDQSSELDFLVEVQVREVTWLHHLLRKGREASSVLSGHLQALLTHEHPEDPQGQGGREHLAEGRRLAEGLTRSLSPEHYEDEEEEEDLESLASSSVLSELQEDTWSCGLSQALSEQDVPPGADLSDCQEPTRSATSLSDGPEVGSVPDGAAPTQEACPQGPQSGDMPPCVSQVPASNPRLQPGTLVTECLQLQRGQQWGRGRGLARCSRPCSPGASQPALTLRPRGCRSQECS